MPTIHLEKFANTNTKNKDLELEKVLINVRM